MSVEDWYLNIEELPSLSEGSQSYIESLIPHEAAQWDYTNNEMKTYKEELLSELLRIQNNRCTYCGRGVERQSVDREHFVHKAARRGYQEFMFHQKNLFAACEFCNRRLKGQQNVIENYNEVYEDCTFTIVNPYIDTPTDYINFFPSNDEPIHAVPAVGDCGKGAKTIEMFRLDTKEMWKERIAYLTKLSLDESRFHDTLVYKP